MIKSENKIEKFNYAELNTNLATLLEGEHDLIANLANTAALLHQHLPQLNWVGFYLLREDELVLGPFQGKPACVRIALGRGVCGKAAQTRRSILVPNVHEFSDHITCDSNSSSEIVLPLIRQNSQELLGVLDLDSPVLGRFTIADQKGLEQIAATLMHSIR
ncbi:MAG: GAF domain-containing protein [Gammaproteobacteria bacterium]|nr:GAF domain-containing protein [Gammaproteobacteria bacterium]